MKYIILFIGCFSALFLSAQSEKPAAYYQNSNTRDFKTVQTASEGWFEGKNKGRGSGYKQWKRWENWQERRLSSEGEVINYEARNLAALNKWNKEYQTLRNTTTNWDQWGENNYSFVSSPLTGTGVLNCLAFHPTNSNVIYTGGPHTGLWVTYNHGSTWSNLTDNYVITGISSIVINHASPNIIYILTGDGDGGSCYSTGVWKTTNGGGNWFQTDLSWDQDDFVRGFKLAMSPTDPNVILAATNEGLFLTEDGGQSWDTEHGSFFYDVVFKPGSGSVAYASTKDKVYKSTNSGESWSQVLAYNNNCKRVQIAVTPDAPNNIFALGGGFQMIDTIPGYKGSYLSTDQGATWTSQSTTPAICSYGGSGSGSNNDQVPYDIDVAVNPSDKDIVYMGAINTWRSDNNGIDWTKKTTWDSGNPQSKYVHSDVHAVEYNPINSHLYIACDGGIYHSTNNGEIWNDLTPGMQIDQFFDFAETPQHEDFMIGGINHNGTKLYYGDSIAPKIFGGDGTGCMIDHSNIKTLYFSAQRGALRRNDNGGFGNYIDIRPTADPEGPFVTNVSMSPTNSSRIYTGWKNGILFYSDDKGNADSWNSVAVSDSLSEIKCVDATFNNIVYATTSEGAFWSTDNAVNWSPIKEYSFGGLTKIVANPFATHLAVYTRGRYHNGNKVYLSVSGSDSNISYNLPNIPVHCALWTKENGNYYIYVGTDIGIYKKAYLNDTTWEQFQTGMPAGVSVYDLEVYLNADDSPKTIRAATFGRGIWEAKFPCLSSLVLIPANDPAGGFPSYQINEASDVITSTRLIQNSNGEVTYKAGNLILLQNGFRATTGNKVIVGIKPCGTSLE